MRTMRLFEVILPFICTLHFSLSDGGFGDEGFGGFSDIEEYGTTGFNDNLYEDNSPVFSQHQSQAQYGPHQQPQPQFQPTPQYIERPYQQPEPHFQPTPQYIESAPPPSLLQSYGPSAPIAMHQTYSPVVPAPFPQSYGPPMHIDSYGPPIIEEHGCAPANPCAPPPPPPMCCAPPPPCPCPPMPRAPCGGGCCLSKCERKRQRRLLRRMRKMRRRQCKCARKAARRARKSSCGRC